MELTWEYASPVVVDEVQIQRRDRVDGAWIPWAPLATLDAASYDDVTVDVLNRYRYRIRGCNAWGCSDWTYSDIVNSLGSDYGSYALLWEDDFEGTTGPLTDHDPSWTAVFGQLAVAASDGAVHADPGAEDSGHDYGYEPQAAGRLFLVADVHWESGDEVGLIVAGEGSFFEYLIRADGGAELRWYPDDEDPTDIDTMSWHDFDLPNGDYRLVVVATFHPDTRQWGWDAWLQDPAWDYASRDEIGFFGGVFLQDPSVGQGIGFVDGDGSSRVYDMAVFGLLP
jgi:hypothetical protein